MADPEPFAISISVRAIQVACRTILIIVLLGVLTASFFIKARSKTGRNRVPFKSLVCSIVASVLNAAFTIAWAYTPPFMPVTFALGTICDATAAISALLAFYTFYRIIHCYLDRSFNGHKRRAWVHNIHKALIGILTLVSLTLIVASIVDSVRESSDFPNSFEALYVYSRIAFTRAGICILMSVEILAWAVFVTVKSRVSNLTYPTGAISILVGSIFWLVSIGFSSVPSIIAASSGWYPSQGLLAAIFIFDVVGKVGAYNGILICCLRWHIEHLASDQQQDAYDYQPFPQLQQPHPPQHINQHDQYAPVAPVEVPSRTVLHEIDSAHVAELDGRHVPEIDGRTWYEK